MVIGLVLFVESKNILYYIGPWVGGLKFGRVSHNSLQGADGLSLFRAENQLYSNLCDMVLSENISYK